MKRAARLSLLLLGVLVFQTVSCGKKAPPSLPERKFNFSVTRLSGQWQDGVVRLRGNVVSRSGQAANASDVVGCRVYHAGYDLETPPCEGCPIAFEMFEEIDGPVVEAGRFRCRFSGIEKKGIHYFRVRLLGRKGVSGPSSNTAKVVVEEVT